MPSQPASPTHKRRRWTMRRLAVWLLLLICGAVIAGELGSRFILGLGDPPLFKLDPEIEYLLTPGKNYRRFGHDVVVNQWSMRAADFEKAKGLHEFRVMVIGDSIVYGGGKIDQPELSTAKLASKLTPEVFKTMMPGAAVTVGNIAAPSWGPPNELAYAKRFGLFDADVVVIVLNSDDVADVPGLEYIGTAWPREKPMLALQELVQVYIWKAVCTKLGRPYEPSGVHAASPQADEALCHKAFDEIIALVRQSGAKVALVQFLKKSELLGTPQPGYAVIHSWAESDGVPTISSDESFKAALKTGRAVFLDDIHPNAQGQALLADLLSDAVHAALTRQPSPTSASQPTGKPVGPVGTEH